MNARRSTNFFWVPTGNTHPSAKGTPTVALGAVTALTITLLAFGMAGCGKPVGERANGSPAAGGMMGQVYTNPFFGFSLAVPAGWSIAPSPEKKASKAASPDALQLLLISEKPINSGGDSNPTLLVMAAECSASGTHTGTEYLERITRLLDGASIKQDDRVVPYAKSGEIRETKVGGRIFYRADLTARVENRPVRQSYFSTIANGHVVSLVIAGLSDAEIQRLEAVVATAAFAQR